MTRDENNNLRGQVHRDRVIEAMKDFFSNYSLGHNGPKMSGKNRHETQRTNFENFEKPLKKGQNLFRDFRDLYKKAENEGAETRKSQAKVEKPAFSAKNEVRQHIQTPFRLLF